MSNCGPGDAPDPRSLATLVELFRGTLLEYESSAGPALGGTDWSARRGSLRARLGEATDLATLSRALVEMEAAFAKRMPEGWASRRDVWARKIAGAPRLTALLDAIMDLLAASRSRLLDDEQREWLRRAYTRLSLLRDTCL